MAKKNKHQDENIYLLIESWVINHPEIPRQQIEDGVKMMLLAHDNLAHPFGLQMAEALDRVGAMAEREGGTTAERARLNAAIAMAKRMTATYDALMRGETVTTIIR